jgi:hypothetical protein
VNLAWLAPSKITHYLPPASPFLLGNGHCLIEVQVIVSLVRWEKGYEKVIALQGVSNPEILENQTE